MERSEVIYNICNLLEKGISEQREKISENQAETKVDCGDARENSGLQALRDAIRNALDDVESKTQSKDRLLEITPITSDYICLGSCFVADFNYDGKLYKDLKCSLSSFLLLEYLDDGYIVLSIESELGSKLVCKKPGDTVTCKNVSITIKSII